MAEPKDSSRGHSTSAAVAAGTSGGIVAACAQMLNDPYKSLISIATPVASSVFITLWPLFANMLLDRYRGWITRKENERSERDKQVAIKALQKTYDDLQKRLENKNLDEETRGNIQEVIREVDIALNNQYRSVVSIYARLGVDVANSLDVATDTEHAKATGNKKMSKPVEINKDADKPARKDATPQNPKVAPSRRTTP